jgi:hypothetical protein
MDEEEEIEVLVKEFKSYPERSLLAILDATERPIVISVAEHLPEWKRTTLVEDLKVMWHALVGRSHNTLMLIFVWDTLAKDVVDLGPDAPG